MQMKNMFIKNTLVKITPMTLNEGITFKERAGLNTTRIIVKVGYPISGWIDTTDRYIKYNQAYDTYL